MKNKLLFAGMAAATLLTAAVQAAPTTIGDDELGAIAGKDNSAGGTSATIGITASMSGDNSANIQLGFYQWEDYHSSDSSTVKGGNQVDGTTSNVQASVAGQNNAFFWGGLGQNTLVVGSDVGSAVTNMAYGTFGNGGF